MSVFLQSVLCLSAHLPVYLSFCPSVPSGFDLSLFPSLLDILAGRKNPRDVSGLVLVNGEKQPKNFKCIAGYVVQVSR